MTKLRAVSVADGRVGWPAVVEYELTAGPNKGERYPVPPDRHSHPDPESAKPPPLSSMMAAKEIAETWDGMPRAGYSYRTIVHDPEAYERLYLAGVIYGPPHRPLPVIVDRRPAPGA